MNKPKQQHIEQGVQAAVATAGAIHPILAKYNKKHEQGTDVIRRLQADTYVGVYM